MTAEIATAAVGKVVERLGAAFESWQVRAENVAAELEEKTAGARYPSVHVYCDKVLNDQVEKFRTFSGRVQVTVEARHTQDRLAGLSHALGTVVDTLTDVLGANRGDWADGMFYGGKYEVSFGTIKHGGQNFMQAAKVTFEIGVSRD